MYLFYLVRSIYATFTLIRFHFMASCLSHRNEEKRSRSFLVPFPHRLWMEGLVTSLNWLTASHKHLLALYQYMEAALDEADNLLDRMETEEPRR